MLIVLCSQPGHGCNLRGILVPDNLHIFVVCCQKHSRQHSSSQSPGKDTGDLLWLEVAREWVNPFILACRGTKFFMAAKWDFSGWYFSNQLPIFISKAWNSKTGRPEYLPWLHSQHFPESHAHVANIPVLCKFHGRVYIRLWIHFILLNVFNINIRSKFMSTLWEGLPLFADVE